MDSYDGDDVMMTIRATLVSCVCLCEDKVDEYDLQKEHVPVVRFFLRREAAYSFVAKVSFFPPQMMMLSVLFDVEKVTFARAHIAPSLYT